MSSSRSVLSLAAQLVATGAGSGYAPFAPGTAGSLVGLLLFWPLSRLPFAGQVGVTVALFLLGTLAAAHLASRLGIKDPGIVVVDEVVGQWVSLLLLPLTPLTVVLGFLLFRLLDVLKPWPARDFERLPGGWGIMADDVMAGIYANLLVRVGLLVWPVA
ncbi:MAG: phosphatidylglycerophosphatase A [Acidobacteria bacterium]|nr:MAG: phosphatidylglycerophosphatase A [Acidobacteriota bacterium]